MEGCAAGLQHRKIVHGREVVCRGRLGTICPLSHSAPVGQKWQISPPFALRDKRRVSDFFGGVQLVLTDSAEVESGADWLLMGSPGNRRSWGPLVPCPHKATPIQNPTQTTQPSHVNCCVTRIIFVTIFLIFCLVKKIHSGLNVPEKRSQAMRDFCSQKASVVFIQESHFQTGMAPTLTNSHFPLGFFSHNVEARSKGTAILIHRRVPFQLIDSVTDEGGCYVFVKGHILDQVYTLATCYAPNKTQHRFLSSILRALDNFSEGLVVLGGDLNVPLEPSWDTSAGRSSVPPHILRSCRRSLHTSSALHPTDKDFTFYAPPSQTYSRIDYIFISHYHLPTLRHASIGTVTWSDHAPTSITISSPLYCPTVSNWCLNDSLLSDPLVEEEGRQVLTNYFEENTGGEVTSLIVWEAHKCVIRGFFIRKGAERAKQRSSQMRNLLLQIAQVSSDHKRDNDPSSLACLTELRKTLATLLSSSYHGAYLRSKAFFHLHWDKSGKLLARMLAKKRSTTYIARLRDTSGTLQCLPAKLLQIGHDYYASLYDLRGEACPRDLESKRSAILAYLSKHATRRVSEQTSLHSADAVGGDWHYASYLVRLFNHPTVLG
uniref:exodeoxyribonuclease III n=1 Tax=Leptobrachium leishanense TaxID=445787 RepID=A0A8C5LRZ7_9ANUR